MYVDTFIPYHMYVCMYACMKIYLQHVIFASIAAPTQQFYFAALVSTAKRLKLAATPHLSVQWLLFAHIGTPVQSRVFTAIPAPNGLAAM